ncbi:hypothetical protein L596_029926 [Steinernema carpocapsae]|uniref:Uncharacterized protein n=1 Tax=Steinernema carpocapsae TaxID=34508 RepID=A0A4U5LR77_STECR|nr:hypothetical protein L596_029926 [Steinernema carpocapsae]
MTPSIERKRKCKAVLNYRSRYYVMSEWLRRLTRNQLGSARVEAHRTNQKRSLTYRKWVYKTDMLDSGGFSVRQKHSDHSRAFRTSLVLSLNSCSSMRHNSPFFRVHRLIKLF